MRADEVFQALLGQNSGDEATHTRRADLSALRRAADIDGFGEPPRTEILKALLAMSGIDPSKPLEDIGDGDAERLLSAADATEAIGRTVAFIRSPRTQRNLEPGSRRMRSSRGR